MPQSSLLACIGWSCCSAQLPVGWLASLSPVLPCNWLQEVARAAASLTSAALRGAQSSQASPSGSASEAGAQPTPDLLERILAALTSERGHSLVGLAVSVACRSGVEALLEGWARAPESPGGVGGVHLHVESLAGHFGHSLAEQRAASAGWLQTLLDWAGSPGGERVVLNAISTFVRQVCALPCCAWSTSDVGGAAARSICPMHGPNAKTRSSACMCYFAFQLDDAAS